MRDRLVNGCASCSWAGSGRGNRVVGEPHSEGRNGDRAGLACSESARHCVRRRAERLVVSERCCRPCPWGVVRSALQVGRREGDAVWHRRSDFRIPPPRTVVKLSHCGCHHEHTEQASTRTRPARKSQGRELRADAVKVRRPRANGVGAKRRTLHGVEHSSILTSVTAGPVRGRSEGRADPAGETAQKPLVNVDLIHKQNAL